MPNSGTPTERKYTIARPQAYAAFDVSAVAQAKEPPTELKLPTIGRRITDEPEEFPGKGFRSEAPGTFQGIGTSGSADTGGGVHEGDDLSETILVKTDGIEKRAVWIVHGMGQQIPFGTQDSLAEGIMSVTHPPPGQADFEPRVAAVKIGDSIVERVELDVFENGRKLELHLYEAYWAPITEGEVKLADVISFLFDGCFRGLLNSFKEFKRAMFGEMVGFKVHWRTSVEVLLALLTVIALMVLNLVIVAAGAAVYGLPGQKLQALAKNWESLTAIASSLSAVALIFGAVLFLAELSKPASLPKAGRELVRWLTWIAFALTLAAVLLGAAYLGFHSAFSSPELMLPEDRAPQLRALATLMALAAGALVGIANAMRGEKRSNGQNVREWGFFVVFFVLSFGLFLGSFFGPVILCLVPNGFTWLPNRVFDFLQNPAWVWPLLILLSYEVRELLIQYVGDVAAYISPNKLDRFSEIRQKIKDVAATSANAVYLARDGDKFLYDKVAVVGHSLGSVIAYDTLNALLNLDGLTGNQLRIAERTCVLETFGSPLDKIAFFFTIQGSDAFHVREQLAAVVQPLISSYPKYRTFPWINVYSRSDIVSGPVTFYDDLSRPDVQNQVQHIIDADAIVPLAAHVDYWRNKEVWQRLCAELT
jgi:hypothetical protein